MKDAPELVGKTKDLGCKCGWMGLYRYMIYTYIIYTDLTLTQSGFWTGVSKLKTSDPAQTILLKLKSKLMTPDIFTFPTWWGMMGSGKSNFKEHGRSVLAKGISPGRLPEAGIGHGEPKQVKVLGAKTPATPR